MVTKRKVIVEHDGTENEYQTADSSGSEGVVEAESESDAELSSETEHDNVSNVNGNVGWADSIAKILKTNKPKGKKTLVLSRAKKLTDVKKETPKYVGFEIEGDDGQVKKESLDPLAALDKVKSDGPTRKKKRELPNLRVKPKILEKDRERTLNKIATKGVVQLFNAVKMQQKDISTKLKEAGPLEVRKEKVLKSIDKRAFLDVLMGEKSQPVDEVLVNKSEKVNVMPEKQKDSSTWSVLRDDFMMSARMKDWDKELEKEMETENVEME